MSGEPQLERSVLEGKERDKLQAIAEALGLKPAARAKKADLVDGILRATGVEVAPPAEVARPKRAPRKRAGATVPASNGDQEAVDTPDLVDQAEVPAAEAAAGQPSGGGAAGDDTGGPDGDEPQGQADTAEAGTAGPTEGVVGANGRSGTGDAGPAVEPVPAAKAGQLAQAAETVEAGGASSRPGQQAARNGENPSGPAPAPQPRSQPPRPQPPGPPGPGNHASPPPGNQHQQGGGGQPPPQGQGGQPQPGQQAAPGEGGEVRRNRRRRGRDRDRLGAGYDQQAQQADQAYSGDPLPCDGLLELRPEGFGFLRTTGYLTGADDVYVSMSQVRKFALRPGDRVIGASRPPTTQERFGALLRIDSIGDLTPEAARERPRFDDLTPVFPDQRLTLELRDPSDSSDPPGPARTTGRILDLLAPLGKGQRGLVVAPPGAGATTLLTHVAQAVEANHPDVDLMVLLIGARPEEVTDVRRRVAGEVIASAFDRPAEELTQFAELAIEVAKRRAETGRDVVVLLDGLTRLARAYNLSSPTGRTVSEGLDGAALHPPKKLLAAARSLEGGGSLTILATVAVGTGSAVDTAISEELTATANTEVRLDGRLAERRLYPAFDVSGSSTRHEERLLTADDLRRAQALRRALSDAAEGSSATAPYELLRDTLTTARTNADLPS